MTLQQMKVALWLELYPIQSELLNQIQTRTQSIQEIGNNTQRNANKY